MQLEQLMSHYITHTAVASIAKYDCTWQQWLLRYGLYNTNKMAHQLLTFAFHLNDLIGYHSIFSFWWPIRPFKWKAKVNSWWAILSVLYNCTAVTTVAKYDLPIMDKRGKVKPHLGSKLIVLVDSEFTAVDYVTPGSLENIPVLKCENKGSSMVSVT